MSAGMPSAFDAALAESWRRFGDGSGLHRNSEPAALLPRRVPRVAPSVNGSGRGISTASLAVALRSVTPAQFLRIVDKLPRDTRPPDVDLVLAAAASVFEEAGDA